MYMNQLTIIGFTGQDVEFHSTPNRTPVATISVAMKGSHVLVQGALRSREYEKDGVKHRVVELRPDRIGKLDRAVRREERRVAQRRGLSRSGAW
jgi:single-stranded DNA-binding protein